MIRRAPLIAMLLAGAMLFPGLARAIPSGIYDLEWTGVVDVFLYNTTGFMGQIPGNPQDNTTSPGSPIIFQDVTICPAGPDGVQKLAGPVTLPATQQISAYGWSGLSFFTFGFVNTQLVAILPVTGLIDNDGGILDNIETETDLLLDRTEDEHTSGFGTDPSGPGAVVLHLAYKADPNENRIADDLVPPWRSSVYTSTGTSTSVMTLDPFPPNTVTSRCVTDKATFCKQDSDCPPGDSCDFKSTGTALDPLCDPAAVPSTCTFTTIQQPSTPCGTQGPNMANWDCSFVEVTNVTARFVHDMVLTRTGDLPPGTCTDGDSDGILDFADNCLNAANGPLANVSPGAPVQADFDEDTYGNACDCDYDQNNTCGFSDFTEFLNHFGEYCPQVTPGLKSSAAILACDIVDQDANDTVGFGDFTLFLDGFGGPPGPSSLSCPPVCP